MMSADTLTATSSTPLSTPKRPHPSTTSTNPTTRTFTIRSPPYTYLHISLLFSSIPSHKLTSTTGNPLDAITARTHLTSALSQFLGLTGTAISIDILHLEGSDVWIRVPREDGAAVAAALSAWVGDKEGNGVGWRVKGRADWLGALGGGGQRNLFEG